MFACVFVCLTCVPPPSEPEVTSRHWHSQPISGLTFTPDGAYMLSGGSESVLVLWQLGSGENTFLPRLGADIRSIAVSTTFSGSHPMMYGVGLANNAVIGFDAASMKDMWHYRGLSLSECRRHGGCWAWRAP